MKESNTLIEENFLNIVENVISQLSNTEGKLINSIKNGEKDKEAIIKKAEDILTRKKIKLDSKKFDELITLINKKIFGYGIIDDLIEDDDITDIKFVAPNNIRQKRKVGSKMVREKSSVEFRSLKEYEDFISYVATKNKSSTANIDAEQMVTDYTTSDKFILRIAIGTEFITSTGRSYMHIRKIPKDKKELSELQKGGMMSVEEMNYLQEGMEKGMSFIVCGKGSAGKTTLINALIEAFPHTKAGLAIQESPELFSDKHPEFWFFIVKKTSGEAAFNYDLKNHSIFGLKTDIDLFCIGEITGGEAYDFVNACYTGYQVLGSLHAYNTREALNKAVHYAKYSTDYEKSDLLEMFQAIDAVIFSENFEIKQITEVEGFDKKNKDLIYNDVFINHKRVANSCEKVMKKLVRE